MKYVLRFETRRLFDVTVEADSQDSAEDIASELLGNSTGWQGAQKVMFIEENSENPINSIVEV